MMRMCFVTTFPFIHTFVIYRLNVIAFYSFFLEIPCRIMNHQCIDKPTLTFNKRLNSAKYFLFYLQMLLSLKIRVANLNTTQSWILLRTLSVYDSFALVL